MITVISTYAGTPRGPADTGGPYAADAASPVTLAGGPDESVRNFAWHTGDGDTASTRVVDHVYARAGTYVASLATVVTAAGGLPSRELTRVRIRPVPPVVDAGPDGETTEGAPYRLVAGWTDVEGAGDYTAVVFWGDDSLPDVRVVSVTDPGPAAVTVTAEHAYCDDGDYTITVEVTDSEGTTGRDTARVLVRNVPPEVDAGAASFAYPCVPVDLVATFVDPGWCDTHTATWDFGDCTPSRPAVVRERHDPPAGTGTASALHTYRTCGTYLARCVVTDDDGGVGEAVRVVQVTGLVNPSFEDGFRVTPHGEIGNGWEPYPGPAACAGDLVVLHEGRRGQRLTRRAARTAGIWQRLGTNPGWSYEIAAWYALAPGARAACRLGLDATGGTDPGGPDVVWVEGRAQGRWEQLVSRVRAVGDVLTVFLDLATPGTGDRTAGDREPDAEGVAWVDDVTLEVLPCAPSRHEPKPPVRVRRCLDWYDRKRGSLGPEDRREGFVVRDLQGADLEVVTWGPPADRGKLRLTKRGVEVDLPFAADTVEVSVYVGGSAPVLLVAENEDGDRRRVELSRGQTEVTRAVVDGPGLVRLLLLGPSGEDLLLEVCAEHVVREPDGGDGEQG